MGRESTELTNLMLSCFMNRFVSTSSMGSCPNFGSSSGSMKSLYKSLLRFGNFWLNRSVISLSFLLCLGTCFYMPSTIWSLSFVSGVL